FAYYKPVRENADESRVLLNLKTRETYEIVGAGDGVFSSNSTNLVLSREKTPSGGPFVRLDLQPYRQRRAPKQIDIAENEALFPSFGEGLPVWEVPHGEKR